MLFYKNLILPLGAKADLTVELKNIHSTEGYTLKLTDISGIEWTAKIK